MANILDYIKVEDLTFISSVITPLLLIYYKFNLDRKISKDNFNLKELFELHNKMHDRLVESEEMIKSNSYLADETKRRLRYNASRLIRYDKTILDDVDLLINDWTNTLLQKEQGNINDGEVSRSRSKLINLIKKMKLKIDKTLN